jgi:hypothetical protein
VVEWWSGDQYSVQKVNSKVKVDSEFVRIRIVKSSRPMTRRKSALRLRAPDF